MSDCTNEFCTCNAIAAGAAIPHGSSSPAGRDLSYGPITTYTTFSAYQDNAGRTSGAWREMDEGRARVAIAAMGLTGESGELVDYLKKWVGHGHPLDTDNVEKELGDVLWYVAELCNALGLDMGKIAQKNVEKLKARYPDGFSQAASINRKS
jgi:NTP pyrophosphatase (non-canonical NTP hydrolase)